MACLDTSRMRPLLWLFVHLTLSISNTLLLPFFFFFFLMFYLLTLERNFIYWFYFFDFVLPLTCAFLGWLSYAPWPGVERATLMYRDEALTNWTTRLGLFPSVLSPIGGHDFIWSRQELWTWLLWFVAFWLVDVSYLQANLFHFESSDAANGCASESQPSVRGCCMKGHLKNQRHLDGGFPFSMLLSGICKKLLQGVVAAVLKLKMS